MTKSATREAADKVTFTQAEVTAKDTAARAGRKNLIINGGFDVWQRSESATGTYFTYTTADRWRHYNGALSLTSAKYDCSSEDVPTMNAMKLTVSSGNWGLMHRIESVKADTFTLSFYIKGSTTGALKVTDNNTSISVTTGWVKHSFIITNGTSGQFDTFIINNTSQTFNGDVYITGVQLELGSVATDFEHRSYGEELALCQRYFYQHIKGAGFISLAHMYGARESYGYIDFPVTMRVPPTGSAVSGTNYYVCYTGGIGPNFNGITFSDNTTNTTRVQVTLNTNATAGNAGMYQTGNANAGVSFDAEL